MNPGPFQFIALFDSLHHPLQLFPLMHTTRALKAQQIVKVINCSFSYKYIILLIYENHEPNLWVSSQTNHGMQFLRTT